MLLLGACTDGGRLATTPNVVVDSVASPAPMAVLSLESAQAATVGVPYQFDLAKSAIRFSDPVGRGLTYTVGIRPDNNGLAVSGLLVSGTPRAANVSTVVLHAEDATGRSIESWFPLIVFTPDLGEPQLPTSLYAYADERAPLPLSVAGSPQVVRIDNMAAANRVTDAGATLGRVLFYDRRLSVNDEVSCSSCHQQQYSFADSAALSIGASGARTRRHSMALTNVRFYGPSRFFRDERAGTLEALVLQPVFDQSEMGLPSDALLPKLRLARFYAPLYAAAFGDSAITMERTASALSQFVRSLKTTSGRIDSLLSGTTVFTEQEYAGQRLFEAAGCKSCHESYAVVSDSARNTGLDASNVDPGAGRGRLKAPSLRNVALRPPYMHDGRFRTLEQVVDFYDKGVQPNPDLDPRLRNQDGSPRRLNLSAEQKTSLLVFLNTLTDRSLLTDPRFSNPFVR